MTFLSEEWRVVPSLPMYEASSLGRVRHVAVMKAWSGTSERPKIWYRGRNYRVARMVCEAFHGPAPFARAVVMHVDDDARNNRIDNIRWGTQKENLNAPAFIAYCRSRTGDNSPTRKARV